MPYTVNKTDSTESPNQYTVQDSVLNTQTDVSFIGKGYAGYGEVIAENFLHLLENFSNITQPTKPIKGQLWFDSATTRLNVFTGTSFQPVGGATYTTTTPGSLKEGDLWVNSTTQQLYFHNGADDILVGPPASTESGFSFDAINSSTDNTKNITYLKNSNELIATISDTYYQPKIDISGFPFIKKGITLSDDATLDLKFHGTATNAESLNGLPASSFFRTTGGPIEGKLNIRGAQSGDQTAGLTIGKNDELTVTVSGIDVIFANRSPNGDILFKVNGGVTPTTAMTIDGTTSRVGIGTTSPTTALQVVGTVSATAFTGSLTGTVNSAQIKLISNGGITFEGALDNDYQTIIQASEPTIDNIITLPNRSGTVITSGDAGTVTGDMLKSKVTFQILDSAGVALVSMYAAGD